MISALIIVFREVIEAGLIVGIVLAATAGVPTRGRWVAIGVAAGILGACLVAAFAGQLANLFEGSGQEFFNAAILLLAVAMLTWHNVWMASHGREMARELKAAGHQVRTGERTLTALAVIFLQNGGWLLYFTGTVWDTSWLLSEGSIAGKLLHTLIGYSEAPNGAQLIVYVATIAVIVTLMRMVNRRHRAARVKHA